MEIDRIDKDNIRVFLVHKDLEERGVTILDLLGNQMQVEKFFYSILEEVDTDHSFSGTQSITFQVMPNEDGLELLISKTSPEFENQVKRTHLGFANPTELLNMDNRKIQDDDYNHNYSQNEDRYHKALKFDDFTYVAKFNSIDDLIDLGNFLKIKVKSQLYLLDDCYYAIFTLYKKDSDQKHFKNLIANINEYGKRTHISPEILAEHGKLLIKNNVFRTLEKFF